MLQNFINQILNLFRRRKFNRIVHFDRKSLEYPVIALTSMNKPRITKVWNCYAYLDQGKEGACTGFATAHELASDPLSVPNINTTIATELYRRAKQLDPWEGEDYEGSTVLAAVKAAQERGWYDEYRWAFGEDQLAMAVCYLGPAILGINWYYGMTNPVNGIITPTGTLMGGHAICCIGYDAETHMYILRNSWGPNWGIGGNCYISKENMSTVLKQGGEACIPIVRKF